MMQCGDYKYILLDDGTTEITEYTGEAESLAVPARLDRHAVTSIGDEAFAGRDSLTSITLPDSLMSIGNDAFAGCESLLSITLPDSLESIGDGALSGCVLLESIMLPDSLTSIGMNPFIGCNSLAKIKVSPDHPTLATINGVLFNKTEKKLLCYPGACEQKSYAVPNGITSIGDGAFYFCDFLTSVTLPSTVTSIGDSAFAACRFLSSITLPDGLTSIGEKAFVWCESLSNITLPGSLTSIGEGAFNFCPDELTFTVVRGSWAASWCKETGEEYTYTDSLDWLNS